jgi:hypothetical protein
MAWDIQPLAAKRKEVLKIHIYMERISTLMLAPH